MGKQAIKRGVRILEEKSRLLSLGAQEQAGLLRRGHQRGVQVTPLRGSHRAKTRPVTGPGSQQRRVPVGGWGERLWARRQSNWTQAPWISREVGHRMFPQPWGKRRAPGPRRGTSLAPTPGPPAGRTDQQSWTRELGSDLTMARAVVGRTHARIHWG